MKALREYLPPTEGSLPLVVLAWVVWLLVLVPLVALVVLGSVAVVGGVLVIAAVIAWGVLTALLPTWAAVLLLPVTFGVVLIALFTKSDM